MNEQTDNFFIHVGGMAALFALQRAGRISATAFLVGTTLCTFADRDGVCWPRREDIAKRIGIPRIATISAALTELVATGFVSSTKRQRGNLYRLHVAINATTENPCRIGYCYDRTSAVSESATAEPHIQIPIVAKSATSVVAVSATSPTYDQSNNETNKETTLREKPKSKSKKNAAPEIAEAAERLVALYASLVKPKKLDKSGSRKVFLATATHLIASGNSEDDLTRAVRNYAAAAAQGERGPDDVKFRYGFQTFFGPKNEHWRDHLDAGQDTEPLSLPIRNHDEMLDPGTEYEMPQADVDLIIAWEKEQARKAAANV